MKNNDDLCNNSKDQEYRITAVRKLNVEIKTKRNPRQTRPLPLAAKRA